MNYLSWFLGRETEGHQKSINKELFSAGFNGFNDNKYKNLFF